MSSLASQTSVSWSGNTCAGRSSRQSVMVAGPAAIARPLPVASCGFPRAALQRRASSSTARPRCSLGASKVSQKAAESKPQPGPPGTVPVSPPSELPPDSEPTLALAAVELTTPVESPAPVIPLASPPSSLDAAPLPLGVLPQAEHNAATHTRALHEASRVTASPPRAKTPPAGSTSTARRGRGHSRSCRPSTGSERRTRSR